MANSFLLPHHYQQAKMAKARPARQWLTMFNEKHLIILLLVISVVTIFVILMNLPQDLQRTMRRESHHVFVPEFDYRVVKGSGVGGGGEAFTHRDDHQHPAPPVYGRDDKPKLVPASATTTSASSSVSSQTILSPLAAMNEYELSVTKKRNKIKEMALFGWQGYEKYAWGENELRPSSKIGHSAGIFGARPTKLGATIVDGLDTMYLMGYQEEYERGREWILKNLNINVDSEFSAFEMNIRFIGGLLSIYTLTEDKAFLIKAEELATALLPIFDTPTGIPYALVNPVKKTCKNYNWASSSCSILAEFGTLSLEFQYLSDLSGNKIFAEKVDRIFQVLDNTTKEDGLYFNYMNPQTGKWCLKDASLGALADSFYEYLLKLWIYKNSPSENEKLLDTYLKAMDAAQQKMLLTSPKSQLVYFAEFKAGYRLDKKMDHLACFTGGLFGLTAKYVDSLSEAKKSHYMSLARNITHTCHESYVRTPTRIGPESFHFERKEQEAVAVKNQEKYYILRPEVIESYFYMWRLTKEQKYRDWAWDAAMAIEKHCRTDAGFAGLRDVYEPHPATDDVQQSFFFAETLKYLFLIFSDDDVLPLDKYVLNTEAHPFRIKN